MPPTARTLAAGPCSGAVPPCGTPQQEHLDIRVDDVEAAERAGFRVFTDPAGHPVCLVVG